MKTYKVVDKLHYALKKKIELKLPKGVKLCPICEGLGEYKQTYNAGCGMGNYKSLGPCDYCELEGLFMQGSGFRYKDAKINERSVPKSVLHQIYNMNKNVIEVAKQLEE